MATLADGFADGFIALRAREPLRCLLGPLDVSQKMDNDGISASDGNAL
jgi:hypothetical protein